MLKFSKVLCVILVCLAGTSLAGNDVFFTDITGLSFGSGGLGVETTLLYAPGVRSTLNRQGFHLKFAAGPSLGLQRGGRRYAELEIALASIYANPGHQLSWSWGAMTTFGYGPVYLSQRFLGMQRTASINLHFFVIITPSMFVRETFNNHGEAVREYGTMIKIPIYASTRGSRRKLTSQKKCRATSGPRSECRSEIAESSFGDTKRPI